MKTIMFLFIYAGMAVVVQNNPTPVFPAGGTSAHSLRYTAHAWKPASTTEEFFALMADPRADIIRSVDDFMEKTRQQGTVYAKLDKRVVRQFARELKFKNGGLSTAQYDIIQKSLSPQDYAVFWEGFGLTLEFVQADDHQGYACVGVGDCATNQTHICTSNC
jgi:hypothetical protein